MHDISKEQERFSEKSVQLHNVRMKMNQDSLHSSIGNSRKQLSDAAGSSVAMQSAEKQSKMSSKMKDMLNNMRNDSSDCTDEDDLHVVKSTL